MYVSRTGSTPRLVLGGSTGAVIGWGEPRDVTYTSRDPRDPGSWTFLTFFPGGAMYTYSGLMPGGGPMTRGGGCITRGGPIIRGGGPIIRGGGPIIRGGGPIIRGGGPIIRGGGEGDIAGYAPCLWLGGTLNPTCLL